MITCPECNKEIADDSAHCGYCGHEIKEKAEKKTMFGMAALDGAKLEQAVQEAQAAKKDAQKDAQPSERSVKLPKPSGGVGAGLEDPDDMGLAKTEMLEFNEKARADLDEAAAAAKASEAAGAPQSTASTLDDSGFDQSGFDQSGFDQSGFDQSGGVNEAPTRSMEQGLDASDAEPAEMATEPSSLPDFDEPAAGDGFGQPSFEQPQSAGPQGGFSSPDVAQANLPAQQNSAPEKSKKGLFIIIGVLVLLFGGGCLATVGYYAYSMFAAAAG